MHPPVKWTRKWAYENPKQALVVLLFGVGFIGFAIWLVIADWIEGR